MGLNQGFYRLRDGFIRKLTNSELNRGYVFASMDRKIIALKKFNVIVNGINIGKKRIDNYGRIVIGKKIITDISNKNCSFKLITGELHINY